MLISTVALFGAALVILRVGPRMARTGDGLARATGLGGALFGVVFLALATGLPEVALSPAAALSGRPRIALGSLLGASAVQLLLVAAIDVAHRRGSIFRDLRTVPSLAQCGLVISVLAVPLLASFGTPSVAWISVGTVGLALVYLVGLRTLGGAGAAPDPDEAALASSRSHSTRRLWARFAGFAALLAGAGVVLERATDTLGSELGLGETVAGAVLAGLATPLPELVTAVAAVRSGALGLAFGDLVGSSALNVALLAWTDAFYTGGSIFALIASPERILIATCLGLTALLAIAVARRAAGIGRRVSPESLLMVVVYLVGIGAVVTVG